MYALDLSLKYEWYSQIESGKKREEYRDIRPYYAKRLLGRYNNSDMDVAWWEVYFRRAKSAGKLEDMKRSLIADFGVRWYDAVRFHKGQGGKQTMLFEFAGLEIGKGKPEWGAPDEDVFIIKLGRRIG